MGAQGYFSDLPLDGGATSGVADRVAECSPAGHEALGPGQHVLGQGNDVPSDSTSLLLTTAQLSGPGAQAEKVAMESVDRIRLSRAPHMTYKYLLANGAQYIDEASGYFRRVANQTDNSLVRAAANEREFICEAMRIPHTPYAPSAKVLPHPAIRPEGLASTLGAPRTLSRMLKDAARVETPFLRVYDACSGYVSKYNAPAPRGRVTAQCANVPAVEAGSFQ